MRIPQGAPTAGWLRLQQHFPYLKRYKFVRPPNGTIVVFSLLGLTCSAVVVMLILPKVYSQYFRDRQNEKRAYMNISREEVAQGLRPWSDPFDREKKQ